MGKDTFRSLVAVLLIAAPYSAWAACYQSSIQSPTPFMGNHGEIFQLIDGSTWEVLHEYEYLYEYYPEVVACPSRGQIMFGGKALDARQVSGGSVGSGGGSIIESNIDGEFEGWEGETVFRLMNGQIWQQSSYSYLYHYSYSPKVIIIQRNGGYVMQVEGVDEQIRVHQLR